jgi:hypothetical protein
MRFNGWIHAVQYGSTNAVVSHFRSKAPPSSVK